MQLAGKVAIVTGSGQGIGKGIALRFAREGASVVVNARTPEKVAAVAAEIRQQGGTALEVPADVTVEADAARLFDRTMESFGKVDILVNNAQTGLNQGEGGPFLKMRADGWNAYMHANLGALFYCTHRAARLMAKAGIRGSIVNISTNGAVRAHRYSIAYDAMKGAMDSFTRAVAVDLGPWGIRVNALRPGPILIERQPEFFAPRPYPRTDVPLGHAGYPEDIAWAALFLASDEARFVTGQAFEIDGGLLAQGRTPSGELKELITPENIGEY